MENSKEIILSGPEVSGEIFKGSFAEFIYSKLKSHPRDFILQVFSETDEKLTSYELLKLSLQTSEGLIKLGLKEDDVVVLAGHNSTQLFASVLGTFFAGGVVAAVETELKLFEMQSLYEQIQPRFVICECRISHVVEECLKSMKSDAKIIVIDTPLGCNVAFPRFEDLLTEVDIDSYKPKTVSNPAEKLLMILCSSGSTGVPKGVGLTHFGIIFQLTAWEDMSTGIDFTQSLLQTSQFFWISGVLLFFMSISLKSRRILSDGTEKNILEAVHKYKPYAAMMSPSEISSMINCPDLKNYDISSLKYLLTGGSPLPQIVIDKVQECSAIRISQGYGMTELSGLVTMPDPNVDVKSTSHLFFGTQLKVVDLSTGKTQGPNSIGEFHLKSLGIMKRYIGNEEATKAALDQDGWYRSGDLGYYNEQGLIYITDRIKEIIKYRNHQIAPVEIENLIQSLPGVKEVAVLGVPHEEDTYHPIAVVSRQEGATVTEEEIINLVKENLSSYKQLRAGVHFVDKLPRTATGKIRRALLKEIVKNLNPKNTINSRISSNRNDKTVTIM